MYSHASFKALISAHFDWVKWESLIQRNGITLDRPYGSHHPEFPAIVYPMNYGFINQTTSTDGDEVDVFVGRADNGLVGLIWTTDYRRNDREIKLLYHCTPEDIYLANGFINFDRTLLEGTLVLRYPMQTLW